MKDDRVAASKILSGPKFQFDGEKKQFVEDIRQALLAFKIVSYAQGFMLLREAAKEYHWNLNYGGGAGGGGGGGIIPPPLPGEIKGGFEPTPPPANPLPGERFHDVTCRPQASRRPWGL